MHFNYVFPCCQFLLRFLGDYFAGGGYSKSMRVVVVVFMCVQIYIPYIFK